jgi:hypothetical protein
MAMLQPLRKARCCYGSENCFVVRSSAMFENIGTVERNFRWSLIPALTLTGIVSAALSSSLWYPAGMGTLFVILASLSFGLALGAVLWFYDLIHTWRILAAVVGVTLTAHLLGLYSELHFPDRFQKYVDISGVGSFKPEVAVTSFAVSLILGVAFLLFTTPRCKIGWAVGIAFACASLEAVTVAVVDGTQRQAWISFYSGDLSAPGLLWQPCLAFFLAFALALKGLTSFSPVRAEENARSSFKSRFTGVGIVLVFWVVTGTWALSFNVREGKRIHGVQARVQAEVSKSLAEAPSFENLPLPASKPLDQVLLLQEINGWKPYLSGSQDYPARKTLYMSAPFPERRTYSASYATAGYDWAVNVSVTEYPNAEWAKYEVRNTPMDHEFIEHANSIKPLVRFGNKLFQEAPYFLWASDRQLILLNCPGPDVIDEFLKAYLVKYPSSL